MINKIKSTKRTESFTRKQWLLSLMLFSTLTQNIFCKAINESDQKKNKTISLPKIIVLQTYKDWSSRLGTNQTTPQTTALVFEESKEVRTTDYGSNPKDLISSNEKITNFTQEVETTSLNTNKTESNQVQPEQVNAHNIAAQVLSRILHITPLLALASNGVPHRRLNYTRIYKPEQFNKIIDRTPIESLNEIEVDSDVSHFKPERMSASGISFPTTLPTTTEINALLFETNPTEPPPDYIEPPSHSDDEHDHSENGEHEDEEQSPPEDQEDYEDDEEMESFRYPVKVTFAEDDNTAEREGPMPFVMPNINLNPESLKQKGCRTVVKEVQEIPVMKGSLQNQNIQNPNQAVKRTKRNSDNNSRKFTSIVMTKECHFPGDEGASSQEVPQAVATAASTAVADTKPALNFPTTMMSTPSYDDYDEDFDFGPQYRYPSKIGLIDRMEPKSSNDRRSYADNPVFRRDNSESTPKEDFGFDDSNFDDFNEETDNQMKRRPKSKKKRPQMSSTPSESYEFDDEGFGPQPKPKKRIRTKAAPLYRNEQQEEGQGQGGEGRGRGGKRGKGGKKKPKKINRSFAFFRKREPKDKTPNESDYAVSYGRGNFQSFSDSYDSDKDGPRNKQKGMRRSQSSDDDDDDDD